MCVDSSVRVLYCDTQSRFCYVSQFTKTDNQMAKTANPMAKTANPMAKTVNPMAKTVTRSSIYIFYMIIRDCYIYHILI